MDGRRSLRDIGALLEEDDVWLALVVVLVEGGCGCWWVWEVGAVGEGIVRVELGDGRLAGDSRYEVCIGASGKGTKGYSLRRRYGVGGRAGGYECYGVVTGNPEAEGAERLRESR